MAPPEPGCIGNVHAMLIEHHPIPQGTRQTQSPEPPHTLNVVCDPEWVTKEDTVFTERQLAHDVPPTNELFNGTASGFQPIGR